jgi:eukaryotic-like serine/threonine-protein kinase
MSPDTTLDGGKSVGRYRIERFLGAGAMGEVYLADDPQIERRLAIKTVRLAGRPQEVEDRKKRLLREARAAGRLLHPNIVTLFDTGEAEGVLYLAFEYVEGSDLSSRVGTVPPLSLSEVLSIVRQVAEALDYAHHQGIVHRDIKPSNILLDKAGHVKVADFGIAKVAGQATELTVAGSVMGSPQYLSPEQIRGEDLDGRSDVFSLGVVLFELLSGRRPFDGDTITTLVYQILHKDTPAISELRGGIPPRLERLLARMLAKDREERVPSAGQVAEELAAIARELPDETLSAPAAADVQAQVPTYALPRRTTAQMPPLVAVAETPAPAAPSPAAVPADRRGLLVAIVVAVVALAAGVVAVGWWMTGHRLRDEVAAVAPATPGSSSSATSPSAAGTEPTSAAPPSAPAAPPPTAAVRPTAGPSPSPAPPSSAGAIAVPDDRRQTGRTDLQKTSAPLAPAVMPSPAQGPRAAATPPLPVPTPRRPPLEPAAPPAPPVSRPRETVPAAPPQEEAPAEPAADRRMKTGMSLAFRVTPPDAYVLVDGTVIGEAQTLSGLKGNPVYTFADPGPHVVKLKKSGMQPYVIAVEAGGGGSTPVVVNLQSMAAADVETADLESYQVRQAIALRVRPEEATLALDGQPLGPAKRYAGRFGHSDEWLELSPGKHRLTVTAPGYRRRDLAVERTGGAEKERQRIDVNLAPGGG